MSPLPMGNTSAYANPSDPLVRTPDELVSEWNDIKAKLASAAKQFGDLMKPWKDRQEQIENDLHAFLNEHKLDNIKTPHGTAYKSVIATPKIVDRTVYLDWCLDQWDTGGNEMLQIGAPQVTAFKTYMEERKKALEEATKSGNLPNDVSITPPGTDVSFFDKLNIRKS